eukprot:scaffold360146_cov38-Attheya_sp.AAC.1
MVRCGIISIASTPMPDANIDSDARCQCTTKNTRIIEKKMMMRVMVAAMSLSCLSSAVMAFSGTGLHVGIARSGRADDALSPM